MVVPFREMSTKNDHAMFKFVDRKHVELIWVVQSIKLLTYKVTLKHFTDNICHNKRKQCSNSEPKEMPLRVQLSCFRLASTRESNNQFFLE